MLLLKTLQSVSSKSAGHIVAFDFASDGFLASHSVIKNLGLLKEEGIYFG